MKSISKKITQAWTTYRYQSIVRQSSFQHALEDLPPTLYEHWRTVAPQEFHGIPTDAIFFIRAAEGLMRFFDCVRYSPYPCALPSKAADSVWHAWISLAATNSPSSNIDNFCRRHFKREIPHLEASAMPVTMNHGLAATLVTARRRGGRDPAAPSLPALFALDRSLKMPNGYAYQMRQQGIYLNAMNARGRAMGTTQFMSSLDPSALLALGFITQSSYDAYEAERLRTQQAAGSGGSCGSSSSCGSNSCDGGSSCGSSCGGGCGGGCGS